MAGPGPRRCPWEGSGEDAPAFDRRTCGVGGLPWRYRSVSATQARTRGRPLGPHRRTRTARPRPAGSAQYLAHHAPAPLRRERNARTEQPLIGCRRTTRLISHPRSAMRRAYPLLVLFLLGCTATGEPHALIRPLPD